MNPQQQHAITEPTRHASQTLLEALRRRRTADRPVAGQPPAPELRLIDANRLMVEQAKGALMLRYGIDSHQAFAVLVRWSRVTRTPVPALARALLHGICEESPQTQLRQRALVRWLEDQLRNGDPELGRPGRSPVWLRASA
jgi:hypothetical protein